MPFRELELNLENKKNIGIGIDVTQKCQAKCPTCFYEKIPGGRDEISPELFKSIIDQAVKNSFGELYLLGGEPVLHRGILDLLDYAIAKEQFNPLIMVTNGLRLADELFCQEISRRGVVVAVQRHVIGFGEEEQGIQDKLMGITGTLSKVNRAFENIEKYFDPSKVAVQCCITKPVVESGQIFKVFEYAREHGFEQVIECTKAGSHFKRGNPLDVSPAELFEVYKKLQEIDREKFPQLAAENLTPQAYGKNCHMPETGVHVLINGDIVPCVGQLYSLGNIAKGDLLSEVLESDKRQFFQHPEERLEGHCKECDYLVECTGGCRGDAHYLTGCFSASAIQCPQLSEHAQRTNLDSFDFIPKDCFGCEMEKESVCGVSRIDFIRRNQDYLGSELFGDFGSVSRR